MKRSKRKYYLGGDNTKLWISKRKWRRLEEKITDLEMEIQGQNEMINRLVSHQEDRPLSDVISELVRNEKDSPSTTFQANLKHRKLFDKIVELK